MNKKRFCQPELYVLDHKKMQAFADCNPGSANSSGSICNITGASATSYCSATGNSAGTICVDTGGSASGTCINDGGSGSPI